MRKITSFLAYTMAVLTIIVAFASLAGGEYLGKKLILSMGITVSPWITGGEIVQTIDHGDYQTAIHETVFQGLLKERKKGFVQIDWIKKTTLPSIIKEDIDYNDDSLTDFTIQFDTADYKPIIKPVNPNIIALGETYKRKQGFTIRVLLNND